MKRALFLLLGAGFLVVVALVLFWCLRPRGPESTEISVILDFFANPNHVPLYVALDKGFFGDEGVKVVVQIPADPSDPVKLAAAGTMDVALTPQINFLIAKAAGLPLIAIGALVETSLGGLLSLKENGVEQLSDLRGRRIGYSLAPLEPILWRTMLTSVGVGADEFELVNVGFNTMFSLLAHNVDAIGAFRNFELVQAALLGREPIFFPEEDYGVPDTYEILLVVNPQRLQDRPTVFRRFLRGLVRGIAFTRSHPEEAFECFLRAHPDLGDELNRRAYERTLPLYAQEARHTDAAKWEQLQEYLLMNGLIERVFPLEELYTDACLVEGR
jgi:putative hydroxymethylpyrimidine transport system substrate-binding protein